jgi:hypothetical protein
MRSGCSLVRLSQDGSSKQEVLVAASHSEPLRPFWRAVLLYIGVENRNLNYREIDIFLDDDIF